MSQFKSMLMAVLLVCCGGSSIAYAKGSDTPEKPQVYYHAFSAPWTPIQLACMPVSLFNDKSDIYGVSIALWLGTLPDKVYGLSYAGIVNFVWKEHCGISISGIWMVMGDNYGVSIAPVNMVDENNGLMLGLTNFAPMGDTKGNGIQIGLVNHAEGGLQIGLINYNANALIPWMVLFNFSWSAKNTQSEE